MHDRVISLRVPEDIFKIIEERANKNSRRLSQQILDDLKMIYIGEDTENLLPVEQQNIEKVEQDVYDPCSTNPELPTSNWYNVHQKRAPQYILDELSPFIESDL